MTTPTTITTSIFTTATTMMTDVVVVPSLEGLLVGCVQLTGTVEVGIIAPSLLVGSRLLQSKEGVMHSCFISHS